LQAQYLCESGVEKGAKSLYVRWLLHKMRVWDASSANGVDVFIANSSYIAKRIQKAYRREAVVVAPPVAVQDFIPGNGARDGFLVASRFVPYKRIEMIVGAFRRMPQYGLTVVGAGANAHLVAKAAENAPNIQLRPPAKHAELISLMQSARAAVFAAEEDFGITMVEAQACGTPVIAFGEGGARDIILPETTTPPTGILFETQNEDALIDAVNRFELLESQFSASACRDNALRFSEAIFREKVMSVIDRAVSEHFRR
jgi:glycosyltransferase involved in cell wall biosynthesis